MAILPYVVKACQSEHTAVKVVLTTLFISVYYGNMSHGAYHKLEDLALAIARSLARPEFYCQHPVQ